MTRESPSILIVEDEVGIAESLGYLLTREGFAVRHVETLEAARDQWQRLPPSLVILDLILPDGSGRDLLAARRGAGDQTAVVVLTSRGDEVDRIVGLELGADDYVTKPFSAPEVVARVKAVLRRVSDTAAPRSGAAAGPLVLDASRRRAGWCGAALDLTKLEFDLLALLASRPGHAYSRAALLERVWSDVTVTERTVDVHIKSIRKKLRAAGADADPIETLRGIGYRLRE